MNDRIRDHSPPISRISWGEAARDEYRQERRDRAIRLCLYIVAAVSLIALAIVLRSTPAEAAPQTVERPAEFPGPVCPDYGTTFHSCL